MNIPRTAAEHTASVRYAQASRWEKTEQMAFWRRELVQAQVDSLRSELERKETELADAKRAYEQEGGAR